jgi:peptidoglycan/LPS O-acetylase OafA/YrhL
VNRSFSTYLDLVRLGAALAVFFSHFGQEQFSHGVLAVFRPYGHEAVVLFFVLSGYVIAYVASERETSLGSFAASRIGRIYSVVLPALLVTILVDSLLLAKGIAGEVPTYQLAAPWKYLPLFLVFGTDLWFLNEDAFSNLPYWSLSYEVWYYVLFAACWYFEGRKRLVLAGLVCLVVGPRQLLLLPVWLAGVAVYRLQRHYVVGRGIARLAFAASLLLLLLIFGLDLDQVISNRLFAWLGEDARPWFRYSQYFLGDYLIALLTVINLLAARYAELGFGRVAPLIASAASLTFALYLLHYPLLELFSLWLGPWGMLVAILAAVWAVGSLAEGLKRRIRDRTLLILGGLAPGLAARPARTS